MHIEIIEIYTKEEKASMTDSSLFQLIMDNCRYAAATADQLDDDVIEHIESDSHVYEMLENIDTLAELRVEWDRRMIEKRCELISDCSHNWKGFMNSCPDLSKECPYCRIADLEAALFVAEQIWSL